MSTIRDSLFAERVALDPILEGPLSRTEDKQMMKDAVYHLTNKLDAGFAQVTEDFLVAIMENIDDDHEKAFVRVLLKRATRSMVTPMLNDGGVWDAIETTVIQVEISEPIVSTIA